MYCGMGALQDVAVRCSGKDGTSVTLGLVRGPYRGEMEITIVRRFIATMPLAGPNGCPFVYPQCDLGASGLVRTHSLSMRSQMPQMPAHEAPELWHLPTHLPTLGDPTQGGHDTGVSSLVTPTCAEGGVHRKDMEGAVEGVRRGGDEERQGWREEKRDGASWVQADAQALCYLKQPPPTHQCGDERQAEWGTDERQADAVAQHLARHPQSFDTTSAQTDGVMEGVGGRLVRGETVMEEWSRWFKDPMQDLQRDPWAQAPPVLESSLYNPAYPERWGSIEVGAGWGSGGNGIAAKIAVIPPLLSTLDNSSPLIPRYHNTSRQATSGLSVPHVACHNRAGGGGQDVDTPVACLGHDQDTRVDTGVDTLQGTALDTRALWSTPACHPNGAFADDSLRGTSLSLRQTSLCSHDSFRQDDVVAPCVQPCLVAPCVGSRGPVDMEQEESQTATEHNDAVPPPLPAHTKQQRGHESTVESARESGRGAATDGLDSGAQAKGLEAPSGRIDEVACGRIDLGSHPAEWCPPTLSGKHTSTNPATT